MLSCPVCRAKRSSVITAKRTSYGVRRQRECANGHKFTSHETVACAPAESRIEVDITDGHLAVLRNVAAKGVAYGIGGATASAQLALVQLRRGGYMVRGVNWRRPWTLTDKGRALVPDVKPLTDEQVWQSEEPKTPAARPLQRGDRVEILRTNSAADGIAYAILRDGTPEVVGKAASYASAYRWVADRGAVVVRSAA